MKKILILLSVVVLAASCSISRMVSYEAQDVWIGRSTLEIMQAMGDPDSIDSDGKDGSILRYEMKPDYEDPSYDILDPDAKVRESGYARFYVDREGTCYWVETDRKLVNPDRNRSLPDDRLHIWLDILFYLPLVLLLLAP